MRTLLICCFFTFVSSLGAAREIYVAPGGTGDGSSTSRPLGDLASAVAQANGGDEILLGSGEYGTLHLRNVRFKREVVFRPVEAGGARFKGARIQKSSHITLRGLTIIAAPRGVKSDRSVIADHQSDHIKIEGLTMMSAPDAGNYRGWSKADWQARQIGGIRMRSSDSEIRGNRLVGFNFGIETAGDKVLVAGNMIEGFSGDAMRVLGQNNTATGNIVKNCVQIDGNHADGLQSWAPKNGDPVLRNLTIEANQIFAWDTSGQSLLRCKLQGIGLFDGFFDNLTIRNNLVVVNQYHGISVYGARGAKIYNNTIADWSGKAGKWPWINVHSHKNGTRSRNVEVYNNISNNFRGMDENESILFYDNAVSVAPVRLFRSVPKQDFRLRPDASGYKEQRRNYSSRPPPLSQRGAFGR